MQRVIWIILLHSYFCRSFPNQCLESSATTPLFDCREQGCSQCEFRSRTIPLFQREIISRRDSRRSARTAASEGHFAAQEEEKKTR